MRTNYMEEVMRTSVVLAGLALMLGLAAPVAAVAAEPPDMSPAADEGAGAGGHRPGMQGGRHHGGWQRNMGHSQRGHSQGRHRPSFIGMLLRNQQQLGLTAQQVDSLRKLGMDARRAEIRRSADQKLARVDLMSLRFTDPVDMGKVEAKVREIEKLKGDGTIARFRTAEAAKAQLTPEQKEKLKGMWTSRMQQRRSSLEEGGHQHMAALQEDDD
jgi:Spy/CpxP family protein refolding chaperone